MYLLTRHFSSKQTQARFASGFPLDWKQDGETVMRKIDQRVADQLKAEERRIFEEEADKRAIEEEEARRRRQEEKLVERRLNKAKDEVSRRQRIKEAALESVVLKVLT